MPRKAAETAAQRRAALRKYTDFMREIGATEQADESYRWRITTPYGPLEVTTHADSIYGAVFTRFIAPPLAAYWRAGDYPVPNFYSGKWNLHADTMTAAVDWFITTLTTILAAAVTP